MKPTTVLAYGRSGSGKTSIVGQLASHVHKALGKRTRLYTADRGGIGPIRPKVNLGLVDVIYKGATDPWLFLHQAALGRIRRDGKWVDTDNSDIGLMAYESLDSVCYSMLENLSDKAATGVNIGGDANAKFAVNEEGEKFIVAGNNMAHYGVIQSRLRKEVWLSQDQSVDYVMWTAGVGKEEDPAAAKKVLGPDSIGKALTTEIPRWFDYTFRLDTVPARPGQKERHLLYIGTHIDLGAGNVAGLGNARLPLEAPDLPTSVVEPADIVQALTMLQDAEKQAEEALRKEMGIYPGG